MTTYNDVRMAMESRLMTTPDIPVVVAQNTKYDPDPSVSFVTSILSPSSRKPSARGPDPSMRIDGLYIMNVFGQKNSGTGSNLDVAERLIARFEGSTSLVDGEIKVGIRNAEIGNSFENPTHYVTPVIISWFAYT